MENTLGNSKTLHLSYLELRRAIGVLGIALPIILSLGAWIFFQTGIQSSISSYYHTGMRDVFVGSFGAIGLFLLSYKGYERADDIAGNLACLFAIGVALFPTMADNATTNGARMIGYIHLAFATLFLLSLIYFSMFLFTRTDPNTTPTKRKLLRNKVYKACGYVMIACMLFIVVYFLLPGEATEVFKEYKPVYVFESVADFAFGIAWSIKGEALLRDED